MNLIKVREEWVKASGRYDRVKTGTTGTPPTATDFADNGANSVINRGIKFVEMRLGEGDPLRARYIETVCPAGTWFLKAPLEAKVITEVWCADPETHARWSPTQLGMRDFRNIYPADMNSVETGAPQIWTPARGRLADANKTTDFDGSADYQDTFYGTDFDEKIKQGILLGPPTDRALTVSMWGQFYSEVLIADTDYNWWTVHHPQIVMQAADFIEAISLKDAEIQKNVLDLIDLMLMPIRYDSYEEESDGIKDWNE